MEGEIPLTVHRAGEGLRGLSEQGGRAIPLMDVEVEDREALNTSCRQGALSAEGEVIKDAEA